MQTVREQMAEALELQDLAEFLADPRHDPREAIRRLEARGDYETGWLDRAADVTELYRSMAKEARRLALDRHRAEPEGRLYPERAVAPMRRAVEQHIEDYRKGGNLFAVAHWEAALKPLDDLGFPPAEPEGCICDGCPVCAVSVRECQCYHEGTEAQREPAGRGTA